MVSDLVYIFEGSKVSDKDETAAMIPDTIKSSNNHHPPPPHLTEDGLILPRKPANPVKENTDRQNLHRELLFNQKVGKNVLNQKTELQKALEKQKDNLAKKELESYIASKTPELEKVIADRAKRLQSSPDKDEDDKVINKELLEVRMKLKTRNDVK
ncbi:unnamed protein product [Acanthoscelides obtectus]|uniref:Protein FAM107B n=1 Tax=Acanthoscelides obtectus TaxID=200917 RepID=A0A9P0K384_ACAOB|nr:unnamed protein product [Acanthoscelides obtectus]CAK1622666.1 Protein FAM107B [Acanthoscelides obtectus]